MNSSSIGEEVYIMRKIWKVSQVLIPFIITSRFLITNMGLLLSNISNLV